jgi:hypothetical protein
VRGRLEEASPQFDIFVFERRLFDRGYIAYRQAAGEPSRWAKGKGCSRKHRSAKKVDPFDGESSRRTN